MIVYLIKIDGKELGYRQSSFDVMMKRLYDLRDPKDGLNRELKGKTIEVYELDTEKKQERFCLSLEI